MGWTSLSSHTAFALSAGAARLVSGSARHEAKAVAFWCLDFSGRPVIIISSVGKAKADATAPKRRTPA